MTDTFKPVAEPVADPSQMKCAGSVLGGEPVAPARRSAPVADPTHAGAPERVPEATCRRLASKKIYSSRQHAGAIQGERLQGKDATFKALDWCPHVNKHGAVVIVLHWLGRCDLCGNTWHATSSSGRNAQPSPWRCPQCK